MSGEYYGDGSQEANFVVLDEEIERFRALTDDGLIEEVPEDASMQSHYVMQRHDPNTGADTFYCVQCETSYETLQAFSESHSQPDGDIIETDYVEADDETAEQCVFPEDAVELQATHTELHGGEEDNSNAEVEEDDDNKFFCCECQSMFNTMEEAEAHDCPALQGDRQSGDEQAAAGPDEPPEGDQTLQTHGAATSHKRLRTKNVKQAAATSNKPAEDPFCHICNTRFMTQKNLKAHMKIHTQARTKSIQEVLPEFAKSQYNELNQFHCEICNKSFEQNLLEVHRNMHKNAEEHTCSLCNKQFENLPSYEVHMQMHKDVSLRAPRVRPDAQERLANAKTVYPCQYCGHRFARPFEKVKHERVHTGEKPYGCEVCGKRFRVSYSLTLHLRTHTDIRPYVCSTCNKRFKAHSVYMHHLKTHGERDYKCDMCPKAYRTSVQLNSHKKSHLKPYSCPDCNRPFSSMYSVKVHMKTHNKANKSNEQLKHRCHICGAVYARIFALRYHIKDQHAEEMDAAGPSEIFLTPDMADAQPLAGDEPQANGVELMVDANEAELIAAATNSASAFIVDGDADVGEDEEASPAADCDDEVVLVGGDNQKIVIYNWE